MTAPSSSLDFDHIYRSSIKHWVWSDVRIPKEVKELIQQGSPRSSLELGCGLGRYSRYVAQHGLQATGVDFSSVAIDKARNGVAQDDMKPQFIVGDVTHLDALSDPFDISFDVGCFHCLCASSQRAYVSEVLRLLKPGGTHLVWALDSTPSDMLFTPAAMKEVFAPHFALQNAQSSRRRLASSHWYWLVRD